MADEPETITRDRTDSLTLLWSDLQTLWAQYRSWKNHDRWLAESQKELSNVSSNTAKELQSLIGNSKDLTLVGRQLRVALIERLNELKNCNLQSQLSQDQKQRLSEIHTRLAREIMIRSLGSVGRDDDYER